MNLFAEMFRSVFDIRAYAEFLKNGKRRTFLYGFLVSLLLVIFSWVLPAAMLVMPFGGIENLLESALPEFTLEDGKLWVEEPIENSMYDIIQGGVYVKIDTEHAVVDEISDIDLVAFEKAVVMDADDLLVKSNGEIIRASFADLVPGNWNREKLLEELVPFLQILVAATLAVLIVISVLGFFLGALVISVFGAMISSWLRYPLGFGELFKMAVHARTLPVLLEMLVVWSPVPLSVPLLLNFGISVFIMWKAVSHMSRESAAGCK